MRLLLDRGANIDAEGGRYGNALSAACSRNNQEIMQILLERGANLNTALIAACRHDHTKSVCMLLARGADANTRHERHGTVLEIAFSRRNVTIAQLLLEKITDIGARQANLDIALITACRHGQLEPLRWLLRKGANVNVRHEQYGTALEIASRRDDALIAELLLKKNADIYAKGGRFFSAMFAHAASRRLQLHGIQEGVLPILLKNVLVQAVALQDPTRRWKLNEDRMAPLPTSTSYNLSQWYQELRRRNEERITCEVLTQEMNESWSRDVVCGLAMMYAKLGEHTLLRRLPISSYLTDGASNNDMGEEDIMVKCIYYTFNHKVCKAPDPKSVSHYSVMISDTWTHDDTPRHEDTKAFIEALHVMAEKFFLDFS